MTFRIEFLEEADQELDDAIAWYANRSSKAPIAFSQRLLMALDWIGQHPELCPITFDGCRYRKIQKFPYLVIFEQRGQRIVVIAIAHGKRRPGYWRQRT